MISRLLYAIERGWQRLLANGKLLFLAVILFVFPLLFVVVLEQFYKVAATNIETAEQQRVGAIHDAAKAIAFADSTSVRDFLLAVSAANSDITKFRLYEVLDDQTIVIISSIDERELGATSTPAGALTTSRINPGETFSVQLRNSQGRLIQAATVISDGATERFVFSEHTRGSFDTLLLQRKLDAYLLLSLVFVFLIALAYWINRQTDWEKRHKHLESNLKERDLFSNMIAHEFRTPLTAIKGYASFLQESKTITPEERRYADTVRESAERLVLLVNDFLEVARIQSGKMKIEPTPVDVRTVLQSVVAALASQAAEKGLQLIYVAAPQAQIITTDHNRLVQVMTNIVSNSIKYTEQGTVEIDCAEDRRGLTIRVKDTGMGITADDQKKLFAPFSRVGGVEKTATTGTGLGMWITKQLVEVLGGTIAIESIKGVGTHVVLHFKRTD